MIEKEVHYGSRSKTQSSRKEAIENTSDDKLRKIPRICGTKGRGKS